MKPWKNVSVVLCVIVCLLFEVLVVSLVTAGGERCRAGQEIAGPW